MSHFYQENFSDYCNLSDALAGTSDWNKANDGLLTVRDQTLLPVGNTTPETPTGNSYPTLDRDGYEITMVLHHDGWNDSEGYFIMPKQSEKLQIVGYPWGTDKETIKITTKDGQPYDYTVADTMGFTYVLVQDDLRIDFYAPDDMGGIAHDNMSLPVCFIGHGLDANGQDIFISMNWYTNQRGLEYYEILDDGMSQVLYDLSAAYTSWDHEKVDTSFDGLKILVPQGFTGTYNYYYGPSGADTAKIKEKYLNGVDTTDIVDVEESKEVTETESEKNTTEIKSDDSDFKAVSDTVENTKSDVSNVNWTVIILVIIVAILVLLAIAVVIVVRGHNNKGKTQMYCTNCGKQVSDGQSFCTACGAPIQKSNSTQQTVNQTQPSNAKSSPPNQS